MDAIRENNRFVKLRRNELQHECKMRGIKGMSNKNIQAMVAALLKHEEDQVGDVPSTNFALAGKVLSPSARKFKKAKITPTPDQADDNNERDKFIMKEVQKLRQLPEFKDKDFSVLANFASKRYDDLKKGLAILSPASKSTGSGSKSPKPTVAPQASPSLSNPKSGKASMLLTKKNLKRKHEEEEEDDDDDDKSDSSLNSSEMQDLRQSTVRKYTRYFNGDRQKIADFYKQFCKRNKVKPNLKASTKQMIAHLALIQSMVTDSEASESDDDSEPREAVANDDKDSDSDDEEDAQSEDEDSSQSGN